MQKQDGLCGANFFLLNQIDQTGHRFAGINRIKKYPLGTGHQPDSREAFRGGNAIARTDLIIIYFNARGGRLGF